MLDSNSTQRVLIVGHGSLFDHGIAKTLTYEPNLLVLHSTYSAEIPFLHIIKRAQPDVILLCESCELETEEMLTSVSTEPTLLGLWVIIINLNNLKIDAYERSGSITEQQLFRRQTVVAKSRNDLIDMLKRKHTEAWASRI
jgi:hypothetical protein